MAETLAPAPAALLVVAWFVAAVGARSHFEVPLNTGLLQCRRPIIYNLEPTLHEIPCFVWKILLSRAFGVMHGELGSECTEKRAGVFGVGRGRGGRGFAQFDAPIRSLHP